MDGTKTEKGATPASAVRIDTESLRVKPGSVVNLGDWDTRESQGLTKADARKTLPVLNNELEAMQELLWAEHKHRILVVIQATDTGGKDGTIRHVFDGVNPQGVKVASFKKPTEEELSHDYLWRVHSQVPGDGEMVLFNRSHYEDVLVVRVHGWVSPEQIQKRYRHIREFEQLLVDEGTTVVKFFLHLSKAEQKERLQARLDEPEKNWKFSGSDLAEREHWDAYQTAFTDMLAETSTEDAPWYVIPADRKWFRNLAVSQVMVDTIAKLDMQWPAPEEGLDEIVIA